MKQFRLMLVAALITLLIGLVLLISAICLPGGYIKNITFAVAAVFVLAFVIVLYAAYKYYNDNKKEIQNDGGMSALFKKKDNAGGAVFVNRYEDKESKREFMERVRILYNEAEKKIDDLYEQTPLPSDVGVARFAKVGLEFKAEGKFAIVKSFKGKAGYHFACEIASTKMTFKPKDYVDSCDYESVGFSISVGYFDGEPLTAYENENGVTIPDLTNLEGQTLELNRNAGYNFQIATVEIDSIGKGQIKFLKWNDSEKVIAFKFTVPVGVNDVVVGAVSLKEDR